MSNETLEEAAKKQWGNVHRVGVLAFQEGAKWQAEKLFKDDAIKTLEAGISLLLKKQEKMYSEEDLREAFRQGENNMDYSDTYGFDSKLTEQQWFEQFKKK